MIKTDFEAGNEIDLFIIGKKQLTFLGKSSM